MDLWTQYMLEEEEFVVNGKRSMKTYVTICKIVSQWEFAV